METELAQLHNAAQRLVSNLYADQETPVHCLSQTEVEQWSANSINLDDLSQNINRVVSENTVQVRQVRIETWSP